MKRGCLLLSAAIVFLIVLGMFFVYGLCQENKPSKEIKVNQGDEASTSSPLEPNEEKIKAENENDKGVFKLGGSEIQLLLMQPQPVFAEFVPEEPEEEDN